MNVVFNSRTLKYEKLFRYITQFSGKLDSDWSKILWSDIFVL